MVLFGESMVLLPRPRGQGQVLHLPVQHGGEGEVGSKVTGRRAVAGREICMSEQLQGPRPTGLFPPNQSFRFLNQITCICYQKTSHLLTEQNVLL